MTTKTIGNDPTETLNYAGINTTGLLVSIRVRSQVFAFGECSLCGRRFRLHGRNPPGVGNRGPLPCGRGPCRRSIDTVMVTGISRVEAVKLLSPGRLKDGSQLGERWLYIPGVWVRDANDISDIGDVRQE